ncbi:MAG: ATP-binding protein [Chloroflexota bacterium]
MRFLAGLTLAKKITLLALLAVAIGVATFSSLGMHAVNQATDAMLEERLTLAGVVADFLDDTLRRALSEVRNTAQLIGGELSDSHLDMELSYLDDTLSRLSLHPRRISIVDEQGRELIGRPGTSHSGDAADPVINAISARLLQNGPAVSGLVVPPGSSNREVFLSSPVSGLQQKEPRWLLVSVDLAKSDIGGFVQPIRLGQTGYVEIVDQNGVVLARTEPGPKLTAPERSDHAGRFEALISAGMPARGVCHTCHESDQKVERRDVLAFVPLSQARWGVVIRQSEDEALSAVNELQSSLVVFGLGLVTVALLLVVIITRDVGGRLGALTAASRRIAEGDLTSPVLSPGKDEVSVLGRTLDKMRSRLQASYGELEQKTRELASLLSVTQVLTTTLELPHLIRTLISKAVETIPKADGAALVLENPDRSHVELACSTGLDSSFVSDFIAKVLTSPAVSDADPVSGAREAFLKELDSFRQTASHASAEVFHKGRHVGSLVAVSWRDNMAFTKSDRRLLQATADYIALAIEREQLSKEAGEAQALLEADRLRAEFISSVSHELRTPLTLIKGCSTSLLRKDMTWGHETQEEFLRVIDEKSDELGDLIDKLLQSAKLEAGALKLEKEPVLLPRLVQKIVKDLTPRAGTRRFTLHFPSSFPVIEADVRYMEQVIRNLLENAVKYSPDNTEVFIGGEVRGDMVILTVRDEGIGVPPEHKDRIFERFYRVDGPQTRSRPGSGLGLFIVKGHVEAHGGKVWAESPGKGSIFRFSLPMAGAQEGKAET